jgi:hypothetical protein
VRDALVFGGQFGFGFQVNEAQRIAERKLLISCRCAKCRPTR